MAKIEVSSATDIPLKSGPPKTIKSLKFISGSGTVVTARVAGTSLAEMKNKLTSLIRTQSICNFRDTDEIVEIDHTPIQPYHFSID